jgi:23S rRNA (guanosine2251-2'-O)-methyltransferase
MPFLAGYHAVHEALRSRPHEVVRVLVGPRAARKRRSSIAELCERRGVALENVDNAALDRLGVPNHQGFASEVKARTEAPRRSDDELVVLVEDVQDPRNLGALLRVCEGAGVGSVLIRDRGSAPLGPTVAKTSSGALEWLDVERVTNSAQAIERLKKEGYWVYGASSDGVPPWELELTGKVALCIGGEEGGLRARTRGLCDALVGLPMRGRVESLNLATAAAALLYEAVRQRES